MHFKKYFTYFLFYFRDFSRFSEDWPGAVVVRFGSVTLSSVVCLETTRVGWAGWGMSHPSQTFILGPGPVHVMY